MKSEKVIPEDASSGILLRRYYVRFSLCANLLRVISDIYALNGFFVKESFERIGIAVVIVIKQKLVELLHKNVRDRHNARTR